MALQTEKPRAAQAAKAAKPRLALAEVMGLLEQAGSERTRKTYARHGACEPMFGVEFSVLKTLMKRIGIDQELGYALWATGNFDARNLAVKIVDPGQMSSADLDAWAQEPGVRMCVGYIAHLTAESQYGKARADAWRVAPSARHRCVAWSVIGALAAVDAAIADAWFAERLAELASTIHAAPNAQREAMNHALIAIGGRNVALRAAATAVSGQIGKVHIDQGDTACKTPDAVSYIDKAWAHSLAKGFASPAAHERSRESMRTRC